MITRISGGRHRGRSIKSPKSSGLRPTTERVRAAMFSIIGPEAVEGKCVLDLYAGTGALGIDALSRGATWVDFVDRDRRLCRALKDTLVQFSFDQQSCVYPGNVRTTLPKLEKTYDLLFVDPPYKSSESINLLDEFELFGLINDDATIIFEYQSNLAPARPTGRYSSLAKRQYGDTSIVIFRAGATNAKSNISRNL